MMTHRQPTPRRSRRPLFLVASLVVLPVVLSGCNPQQAAQVAAALQQAAAMSGASGATATMNTGAPTSTGSMVGTYNPTGATPANASGSYGPSSGDPAGGLPVQDGDTEIPDFGSDPTPQQIGQMLEAAARRHGIPADYLKAIAWQESRWNPRASSFDGGHGKGIMQIDDRSHDFASTPEVWNPAANIEYGANFLAELYERHGDWDRAFRGYNGGSDYPPLIRAHIQSCPWQSEFGLA